MKEEIRIKNKKAFFEFSFSDKFIAGIMLKGTEIKSIRQGKASITESFCVLQNNEVFIRNMQVQEYEKASFFNHAPKRDRKLLLQATEIKKIEVKMRDAGMALIPLQLFINEKGLAKLEIGLGKGKKIHDKRDTIKDREVKREIARKVR